MHESSCAQKTDFVRFSAIIEGHWTPRAARQASFLVAHMTPQDAYAQEGMSALREDVRLFVNDIPVPWTAAFVPELSVLEQRPDLELVKLADGARDNWSYLGDSREYGC